MKLLCGTITILLSLVSASFAQSNGINIVPKPREAASAEGSFTFNEKTKIIARDSAGKRNAEVLNELLHRNFGLKLAVTSKPQKDNAIAFITALPTTGVVPDPEQYLLTVESGAIRISGSETGQFYGIQSLMQLIPASAAATALTVPAVKISDAPRFRYRGMHLDVGRHFQPVDFVKKYIDLMSQFKFNNFHWHLTDDQGWRIEIKKYPKLTEIGSYRSESHEGPYSPTFKGDKTPHSGFYTQEQIKDVVAYARERHITVIPEIELPGHASAALAAYPQLGCKSDYEYKVQKTWGIFKEVYCPTEETFKFLEDVIDETIKLFPDSPYVHIGGDEVLKDHWKESAFVQELKQKENLKDEHEVQSYFVRRMEKFINSRGKKIIGWDEILEGGLAPNATVMSWRGMKGGIEAAKAKHDVIMTPTDFVYFDYGQGDPATEPLNIGGYVPLTKVYDFEPVPADLSVDEAKYILGGQANIWTEYLENPTAVEYMAFPRMLALSEVLWSRKEDRNYQDFYERMLTVLPRLDKQNVNYRIPDPIPVGAFLLGENEAYAIEVKPPIPGSKVYFTKDGSTPTERSPEAPQKISVFPVGDEVVTIKTIVVLPNGRKSSVYAATFLRGTLAEPDTLAEPKPGVTYELTVPDDEAASKKGETKSIQLNQFEKTIDLKKNFVVTFDGYFKAPADGVYELQVDSTWDAAIVLGGKMVINDAGTADNKRRSVLVPLKAGLHKISLRYNHRGGTPNFRFRWGVKGQGLRQAYGGEFVH